MASLFKRLKAKVKGDGSEGGEEGEKKQGFVLNLPSGQLSFTDAEADVYTKLALMLDVEGDDSVGGRHGAAFLRRSGLSTDQLREVWKMACGGKSKAKLSRDNWFVACKLVALAQSSGTVAMEPLHDGGQILPFPNFNINLDIPALPTPMSLLPVAVSVISVAVTNPHVVGVGMSRYTAYTVTTTTTLGSFPRKEMTTERRFSDFIWLHTVLCAQYGGCLIPNPPDKKSIGNMDVTFVEARRNELDEYLRKVVMHPLLVRSFPLRIFLDATVEGLEAFKDLLATEYAGGAPPGSAASQSVFKSFWNRVSSAIPAGSVTVEIPADEDFAKLKQAHVGSTPALHGINTASTNYFRERRDCGYQVARLGSYILELGQYERRSENAGSSAFAERQRRDEEATAEAVSGSATAGASGTGAGGGAGAGGSGGGLDSSWSGAQKGQWAGTAFDGAVNPDDDDARWGPSFVSNEDATRALFEDSSTNMFAPAPARRVAATPKKPSRFARVEHATPASDVKTSAELFCNFGAAVEAVSNVLQDQLDAIQNLFLNPLAAQVEHAGAVSTALTRRDESIAELQQAHADMASKKRNYAAARANAKGAAAAEASMARAEKKIAQAEKKLETVTTVMKAEMREFNRKRRFRLSTMMLELARAEARNAAERNSRWEELMRNTTKDDALFAASKHRIAGHTLIDHAAIAAAAEEAATRERETLDPSAFL